MRAPGVSCRPSTACRPLRALPRVLALQPCRVACSASSSASICAVWGSGGGGRAMPGRRWRRTSSRTSCSWLTGRMACTAAGSWRRGRRRAGRPASRLQGFAEQVGDEQLLAGLVRLKDGQAVAAPPDHGGLSPAQPADVAVVHRDVTAAGQAGAVVVLGAPADTAPAHVLGVAGHAPAQAVLAGGDVLRGGGVAALAQARRVVVVEGGADTTRWWGERPAGQALVAEVDARVGKRDRARAADRARLGWSHAGGAERRRLRCGVTTAPTAAAGSAGAAFVGFRAATFSGSQISRSAGLHRSTAQMTSRSSRRTVVGVLVHSGAPGRRHGLEEWDQLGDVVAVTAGQGRLAGEHRSVLPQQHVSR